MQDLDGYQDDELVVELDVHLSQPEEGCELFLLQHPHRVPAAGVGSDRMVEDVRIRPKHRRIEMSLSLFPNLSSSDAAYSERSFDFEESHAAERPIGEKQVLRSSEADQPITNLVVAMYLPPAGPCDGNGSVTLVPVDRTVRMRPSFDYIDELDAERQKEKAMAKAMKEKEKGTLDASIRFDEQKETDENNDVEVEMTFMRRESERAAGRRKASYAFLKKIEEEDAWLQLPYFGETSVQSEEARGRLFAAIPALANGALASKQEVIVKKEEDMLGGGVSRSYIDMLYEQFPSANPIREATKRIGETTAGQGSMRTLRTMRVDGAVQIMLTHARLACFEHVAECVAPDTPREKVLSAIRQVGYLLRGCWIRKSPRRTKSRMSAHKLPARVIAARVLVLSMFRESRTVHMSEIFEKMFGSVTPPHIDLVESFLTEVAERRNGHGWEFRMPDDYSFEVSNPEIVSEEESAWELRVREATTVMLTEGVGLAGRVVGSRVGPNRERI
jgi:RPC5 protein